MENVSLFRVEESEVERELRTMLGLATPEDPEPTASAQLPPQVPENPTREVETTSLVLDPAPPILNSSNPPVQSPNDMQVEQTNTPPIIAPPSDQQTSFKGVTPVSNIIPSTTGFGEGPPPVSEPPEPSSWNPIGFVDDEEEEEEEIPSINMDSDSD